MPRALVVEVPSGGGVATALVAHGHYDELAMHVRAARRNGLTAEEIGAVLLQTAVYCGVPAANHAFKELAAFLSERKQPAYRAKQIRSGCFRSAPQHSAR